MGTASYVLNLGSGSTPIAEVFPRFSGWTEIRVDADPEVRPDVVADLRALPLEGESVDAAALCGVLEHFPEMDVPRVLGEARRVLRPSGVLGIVVPDLVALAREIIRGRLQDVLLTSRAGPVRTIDVLYGFSPVSAEQPLWGHRTGFTSETLAEHLGTVGFEGGVTRSERMPYMLIAEAVKV